MTKKRALVEQDRAQERGREVESGQGDAGNPPEGFLATSSCKTKREAYTKAEEAGRDYL